MAMAWGTGHLQVDLGLVDVEAIAGFQCHGIQNKNQNRSMDKVQNLGNERR